MHRRSALHPDWQLYGEKGAVCWLERSPSPAPNPRFGQLEGVYRMNDPGYLLNERGGGGH